MENQPQEQQPFLKTLIKMQFDPNIARDIGVCEAIMYANLEFWCAKNQANNKHFHDGHYWTYNSQRAFTELFGFWSKRQIQKILKNLKNKGYIKTGNYNLVKYDKTSWFTVLCPNKQKSLAPFGAIDDTERSHRSNQNVPPIPDVKPDNSKPYIKAAAPTGTAGSDLEQPKSSIASSHEEQSAIQEPKSIPPLTNVPESVFFSSPQFQEAWSEFKNMRNKIRRPMTPHAEKLLLKRLDAMATGEKTAIDILERSIINNWQDVYPLKDVPVQLDKFTELAKRLVKEGVERYGDDDPGYHWALGRFIEQTGIRNDGLLKYKSIFKL